MKVANKEFFNIPANKDAEGISALCNDISF
jgi:hypothetical protein